MSTLSSEEAASPFFYEMQRDRVIQHLEHLDADEIEKVLSLCRELRIGNGSVRV